MQYTGFKIIGTPQSIFGQACIRENNRGFWFFFVMSNKIADKIALTSWQRQPSFLSVKQNECIVVLTSALI